MKTMIGDEFHVAQLAEAASSDPNKPVASSAHALLCTDLVGSLSDDSVLQIMSDSTTAPTSRTLKDSSALSALNLLLTDKKSVDGRSEENVSDIDLSFLNEGIISDPKHLNESVVKELLIASSPSLNLNFSGSHVECDQEQEIESAEANGAGDTVLIDVSQPIQLSQNSLIVVNGQKCVLQHDPRTGQVVAYPVQRPRRRRGRPRKTEQVVVPSEKSPSREAESVSEGEREKGLLEVLNDDGSLVRRSSRKRKKAKTLKDYETGNLQQELGSDVDEVEEPDVEPFNRRRKPKGPGRPRKFNHSTENVSENSIVKESARPGRGRPPRRQESGDGSQAFLVQTADGQTLVLQVPLSSIPPGTTLQEMAQQIARKLNSSQASTAEEKRAEPALQDHSIGSTTHFLQQMAGEEICQEITLECDQSVSDRTSGANLVEEENNLNAPESLEDNFCLDVSSTTNSTSVDVLCPFNEHLIDHSFYVMKQPKTVPQKDPEDKVESTILAVDDPKDLFPEESKDPEDTVNGNQEQGSEVLAVLLQESLQSSVPEKPNPALVPAEIPPGPKKCKICTVPYFTEEEMVEHFKAKHPKCICPECPYTSEHPYGIKRHSYRHANQECVCSICNKKYKDLYILKMHVKMVHLPPEVLFKCDTCSKEFTRKAHLKRHQRIHAPIKQYRCPLCDYHGCEKSDVTKHLLIHEEPKFKCEVCGKAFRHLKNKELHIKRHSGQRDYKCAACNFYGYTYTDIRKHIERRHSALCHFCKQVFADPELCKEHKRLGLCHSSLLEAAKIDECPPTTTLHDKKEIVLFGEVALEI